MPFTDVEICSNALVLLGHTPISSFTDETPAANVCAMRYPMLREHILTEHPWNFTMDKVQLSQDVTPPVSTYDHKYLLPSDGVADGVVALYNTDDIYAQPITAYIIQSGFVLTNADLLYADYQKEVDESKWPSYFANLMAHCMAADIAMSITKKVSVAGFWDDKTYGTKGSGRVGGIMGRARVLDSYHAPPNNKPKKFPLVTARRSGVDG